MRRRLRYSALTLATLIVAAAPAQGAMTTVKESTNLDFGEEDVIEAACESAFVVSGGFGAPGFDPIGTEGHYILPFQSHPTLSSGWTGRGYNGNPVAGDFFVYARCTDALDDLEISTEEETITADTQESVDVQCDPGQDVVSGGFLMEDEGLFSFRAVESRRLDKATWRIIAKNGENQDRSASAYAVCTGANLKVETRTKAAKKKNNRNATATAKCKRGELAVSGGWDGIGNDDTGKQTYVFESRPKGARGWKSSAAAYTDGGKLTWKSLVYCVAANKLD